jgi:hypothetical protein
MVISVLYAAPTPTTWRPCSAVVVQQELLLLDRPPHLVSEKDGEGAGIHVLGEELKLFRPFLGVTSLRRRS